MPYACPLCDETSNRKGRPFETIAAVVGHIDAKRDDTHAGETGADHRDEISSAPGDDGLTAAPVPTGSQQDASPSVTDGGTQAAPTTPSPPPAEDPDATPGFDEPTLEERLDMTPSELEESIDAQIDAARSQGYDDGYQDGYATAESDLATDDAAGTQSGVEADDPGPCPNCGGELVDFRGTDTHTQDGHTIPTPDEFYCSECNQGWNTE